MALKIPFFMISLGSRCALLIHFLWAPVWVDDVARRWGISGEIATKFSRTRPCHLRNFVPRNFAPRIPSKHTFHVFLFASFPPNFLHFFFIYFCQKSRWGANSICNFFQLATAEIFSSRLAHRTELKIWNNDRQNWMGALHLTKGRSIKSTNCVS